MERALNPIVILQKMNQNNEVKLSQEKWTVFNPVPGITPFKRGNASTW